MLQENAFFNYLLLKLIEKNEFESIWELRKEFKKRTKINPNISSFYKKIKWLETKNWIKKEYYNATETRIRTKLSLTKDGKKRLDELEKLITFALTMVSCGTDS